MSARRVATQKPIGRVIKIGCSGCPAMLAELTGLRVFAVGMAFSTARPRTNQRWMSSPGSAPPERREQHPVIRSVLRKEPQLPRALARHGKESRHAVHR